LPETFAEQSGRFGSRDGEPAAPRLTVTDIHERLAPAASTGDTLATPTGPLAIDVRHLTKKFGERTAFNDVSFDVRQGEVFGFLGPNGAGKTTMVRTLSTLIQATSGSASVAGLAVCEENGVEIRQRISVMPEVPGLYSRLSVNDNLEFFVGLYALGDAKGRIARALHAVNLSTRSNDLCASLSKGLRQRVSIARALLSDPEIIFLDEPTSGLDPVATREVSELIEGLRSRGVTIFLTTHRLEEAEHLCDRVAILNTTLRIVGRTSDLRQQLFQRSLLVATLRPLDHPEMVFASIVGVDSWKTTAEASYELMTPDPRAAAPEIVRALVHAGADVVSIAESQHSLEDVYLQLVGEDAEVAS
jgi:ABC-2 type transport system ATP-binding protein